MRTTDSELEGEDVEIGIFGNLRYLGWRRLMPGQSHGEENGGGLSQAERPIAAECQGSGSRRMTRLVARKLDHARRSVREAAVWV